MKTFVLKGGPMHGELGINEDQAKAAIRAGLVRQVSAGVLTPRRNCNLPNLVAVLEEWDPNAWRPWEEDRP